MRLGVDDVMQALEAHFSGNILYQPLQVTSDVSPRPVAQIVPSTQILQSVSSQEPRSFTTGADSRLHLKGLLHHAPAPRKTRGE